MKNRFAVCLGNTDYPASLELHKVCRVIPDERVERDGNLRVIDESGEDYLYPAKWFLFIDLSRETEPALIDSFDRDLK